MAVPQDERAGVMSATDYWGMLGSQTALYMQNPAGDAYRRAKLGMIGNVDTYMSQNVQTHDVGDAAGNGTPLINGGNQGVNYEAGEGHQHENLIVDGFGNNKTLKQGDVFTIANVFAVNPVTKATEHYLQQFVVMADTVTHAAGGDTTIPISPAIITSGAFQTVSAAPGRTRPPSVLGTAGTGYKQNMVFHKNAFALTMVPMELPPRERRRAAKLQGLQRARRADLGRREQHVVLAPRRALRRQGGRTRLATRRPAPRNHQPKTDAHRRGHVARAGLACRMRRQHQWEFVSFPMAGPTASRSGSPHPTG